MTLGNLPSLVNSRSNVTLVTPDTGASTPMIASSVEPSFEAVDVKRELGETGHVPSRPSTSNEASDDTSDDTSDGGSIVMEIENEADTNDRSLRPENCPSESTETVAEPGLVRPTALKDSSSEASTLKLLTSVEPTYNEPQIEQSEAATQAHYIDTSIISPEVCISNLPLAVSALCADED